MATRSSTPDAPGARLLRAGGGALSDAELLGLLLPGGGAVSSTALARDLLAARGGLVGLACSSEEHLRVPGFGPARRAAVLAAVELARRFARARLPRRRPLVDPEAVAEYLGLRYHHPDYEVLGALYLDSQSRLIAEREIYRGTVYGLWVEPRPVLQIALSHSALSFILFHTHPGGDAEPTAQDLAFTRRMAEAGEVLGIRLVDHLILGDPGRWVSLSRRGGW